MQNHQAEAGIAACQSLFALHPEDVVAPIEFCADGFDWVEEIAKTIAADALDPRHAYRIKHLAAALVWIANELGQYARGESETRYARLVAAGIIAKESRHV